MWPPRTQGPRLRGDPGPGRLSPRHRAPLPPRWRPRKGRALPRARPPAGPRLAPFPGPLANPAGSTQSLRRRQRCARHKSDSLRTRTRLLRYRLFILTVKDSRAGRRAPPLPSRPAVGAYSSAKSSCFVRPDGLAFGAGGGGSPSAVAPGRWQLTGLTLCRPGPQPTRLGTLRWFSPIEFLPSSCFACAEPGSQWKNSPGAGV